MHPLMILAALCILICYGLAAAVAVTDPLGGAFIMACLTVFVIVAATDPRAEV
jgi:hypothetical protein